MKVGKRQKLIGTIAVCNIRIIQGYYYCSVLYHFKIREGTAKGQQGDLTLMTRRNDFSTLEF